MKPRIQRFQFLRNQDDHAIHNAPHDKVPACTMPDSGCEPGNHGCQINRHPLCYSFSKMSLTKLCQLSHSFGNAHWIKNIIPEPGSHGNMPAPPIFRNIFEKYGRIKFSATFTPNTCAIPMVISMPPVKSAYSSMP